MLHGHLNNIKCIKPVTLNAIHNGTAVYIRYVQPIITFKYRSLDHLKFTTDIFLSEKCLQEKNGRVYQHSERSVKLAMSVVKWQGELSHWSVTGDCCALAK